MSMRISRLAWKRAALILKACGEEKDEKEWFDEVCLILVKIGLRILDVER